MILDWFRRRPADPDFSHLHFVVYTRPGCHLCEDTWSRLRQWQQRCRFALESVDVDSDTELQARFGNTVPVVAVNGKVRFKGCVNTVLLKRLLTAEAGKSQTKVP